MRFLKRFTFSTLAFLMASSALAEKSAPIQGQLDNGLKYTILPLHDEKGRMEVRVRVNAGAVDEDDNQAGVAHMLEHLVFRGTKAHPNGLMPYLHEQKWVRGRNYNAVTTMDNTTYMMTPPVKADLEQTLDTLSEMLFGANLTQADLDDERKIILEEWRQGLGVAASMNEQRTASVRANSRYARHRVIGTEKSIKTMPASELQAFYQSWYAPNNMNLLIVGDVEPEQAIAEIQKQFGQEAKRELPKRDYLEPALADRLQVNKLQDPRSGVSQIAYILRFDESKSREQTEATRRERLIDRLTLSVLTQRLRNQAESLPKGVTSLTVRKSDIGRNTTALGLFASVAPTAHQTGLKQIFEEVERLKRFPITEEELAKQTKPLLEQIENAKKHDGDRDFSQWMQVMIGTALLEKPYLTQPEIAVRTEKALKTISVKEVNERLNQWLSEKDRIVQYQPPRETKVEPITEQMVLDLQAKVAAAEIAEPQKEKEIVPMSLENLNGKGSITSEQTFEAQNVKHWTLSNGDKVVWLKTDLAKDKTYFQAQSSAGFKAEGLGTWQSQLASQLIAQNAPLDWEIEQLNRWKELNKVSLSVKQTASKFHFDGTVDNAKLADLLRLFYAYQAETKVKDGLDETKESITRAINLQNEKNDENERLKAVSKLRYGIEKVDDLLPSKAELDKLTEADLNAQWKTMMTAPTTYFFVNNVNEEEMKPLVTQFLADLPRHKRLNLSKILPISGKGESRLAINPEPKADIRMWTFTEQQWQGKDAVLVSLLRNIATNKLKLSLRDEQLGVYSLRFDSYLSQDNQRVESELAFTANPDNADKLVAQARSVLADLANNISEEDIAQAKSQFQKAEMERLKEPRTWLARLILSENQFENPQYLSDMHTLADSITLENLKIMAGKIYNAENEKVFIILPKTK